MYVIFPYIVKRINENSILVYQCFLSFKGEILFAYYMQLQCSLCIIMHCLFSSIESLSFSHFARPTTPSKWNQKGQIRTIPPGALYSINLDKIDCSIPELFMLRKFLFQSPKIIKTKLNFIFLHHLRSFID